MAERPRVDAADLREGAAHVDNHAAELSASHAGAHTRMVAAARGFIGASAPALAALTAHWEAESAGHVADLTDHATLLRTAGGRYEHTDTDSSRKLDQAGAELGDRMGLQG